MKLAFEMNAWGGVVGTPGAVTDIGSGFYVTPGDVTVGLDAAAAAGFAGFELFDGNLLPFEDDMQTLRAAAADRGLTPVGVYSGGHFIYRDAHADELARFTRSITLASSLGARHFVLGGGAIRHTGRQEADYEIMASLLDEVARRAEDAGLIPSYHPHLGSIAESPDQIDALFGASSIGLCADVAHIAGGGGDAVAVIQRYADRLVNVHLKDLDAEAGSFMPLGEGDLPMSAIIRAVVDAGYDDWITVELDGYAGDASAAAKRSFEFLSSEGLVS